MRSVITAIFLMLVTGALALAANLNINQASAKDLQNLPGIGKVKAQAIVDYRNEQGAFQNVRDLLKVPGIGAATLEKIEPQISLQDATD